MSKGLDALKELMNNVIRNDDKLCDKKVAIIEKELKALEIIKEKPQATLWFVQHYTKKMGYEDMISLFKEDITKEQFELLKEVLL